MYRYLLKIFVVIGFISLCLGCEKFQNETDPNILIIGKWEPYQHGPLNNLYLYEKPTYYNEYLKDSVFKRTYYEENEYDYLVYWFEDSILVLGDYYQPESLIIRVEFNYKFLENNSKLLLTSVLNSTPNIIFKRID